MSSDHPNAVSEEEAVPGSPAAQDPSCAVEQRTDCTMPMAPLRDGDLAAQPLSDSLDLAPAAGADTLLEPGVRIDGRYTIERLLGEGAMGVVYLAHDEMLAHRVALKFMRRDRAGGDEELRQLRAEVLLAQRITHRNICRTYDLEELAGYFVIKMEYIDGETLAERIERAGRLPLAEALGIARAIAAGLEAAHADGVIHCDLKPQNILIEHATGRIALMDFGIARAIARSGETGDQRMWGTPEYMAPEQARSLPPTPRTDLYALGCVLYQLVVGKVPYGAPTPLGCVLRHLNDPIPDPQMKCPNLPAWVARVIQRLLEKAPERRYPDAHAVLVALTGPRRLGWRHGVLPLAALAGLGVIGLGGDRLLHPAAPAAPAAPAWQPRIEERAPSYDENADCPIISPDGQTLAYTSNRDKHWRIYIEPVRGDGVSVRPLPQDVFVYPPRWSHDSRAILGVKLGSEGDAVRLPIDGGPPEVLARGAHELEDCAGRLVLARKGAAGCPECMRVVMYEGAAAAQTMPPSRERELFRSPPWGWLRGLRCDRAGQQLAFSMMRSSHPRLLLPEGDLYTIRLADGAVRQLTFDHQENGYPVFAPDGRSIIYSSARGGTLDLWEISTQGGTPLRIPSLGTARGPEVPPDGRFLIYDDDVTSLPLYALSLATGERRLITTTLDDIATPHATPDGREVVALLTRQHKRYAAAVALGTGVARILAPADVVTLTPDGQEVVYAQDEGESTRLLGMPRLGGAPRVITRLPGPIDSLLVDGDGWVQAIIPLGPGRGVWRAPRGGGIAVRANIPGLLDVRPAPTGGWRLAQLEQRATTAWHLIAPGRPLDDPQAAPFDADLLAWTPDGQSFYSLLGNTLRRHPVGGGEPRPVMKIEDVEGGLAFSPDGQTLYLAQVRGRVYRRMITNFADRRRPLP